MDFVKIWYCPAMLGKFPRFMANMTGLCINVYKRTCSHLVHSGMCTSRPVSHGPFHMARFTRPRTRPFPWLLMLLSSLIYLICSSTLNIIESNIEDIEANAYRLQFVETLAVKDATHPSILDDWPRRLCRNSFWHAPVTSHQNLKEAGGVMLLQSYCRSTHFETLQTGNHMLLCTQ